MSLLVLKADGRYVSSPGLPLAWPRLNESYLLCLCCVCWMFVRLNYITAGPAAAEQQRGDSKLRTPYSKGKASHDAASCVMYG